MPTPSKNAKGNGVNIERLVRSKELRHIVGLSPSTISRLIKEGRFPKPIHPTGTIVCAWPLSVVQAWVADRIAGKAA
jgi:predicted DNA-binding transcriptional regulator AlpA